MTAIADTTVDEDGHTGGDSASRTTANLEGADLIRTPRVAVALQYRKREGT